MLPEMNYQTYNEMLYSLASKECNIDGYTNLKNLYWHEIKAQFDIYADQVKKQKDEMDKIEKKSKQNTTKMKSRKK